MNLQIIFSNIQKPSQLHSSLYKACSARYNQVVALVRKDWIFLRMNLSFWLALAVLLVLGRSLSRRYLVTTLVPSPSSSSSPPSIITRYLSENLDFTSLNSWRLPGRGAWSRKPTISSDCGEEEGEVKDQRWNISLIEE